MGRPRKDNKPISMRISTSIFNKLEEFCEVTGLSKTVAVERAIEKYIEDYEKDAEMLKKMKR